MNPILLIILTMQLLPSNPLPQAGWNLRPHPTRAGYFEPIKNLADPQQPTQKGPLSCDTPLIDFGRIRAGQDIWVTFPVTNVSDRAVIVRQINACSCTGYPTGPKVLMPGQTGIYPVGLSTKNASGPVRKTVTLRIIHEFDVPENWPHDCAIDPLSH